MVPSFRAWWLVLAVTFASLAGSSWGPRVEPSGDAGSSIGPAVGPSPRQDGSPSLRIVAFGDWGVKDVQRPAQLAVRDALSKFLRREPADFGLLLGDNFYPKGVASATDPIWKERFEDVYAVPEFRFPFFAVPGNHDHGGSVDAQIEYARRHPRRWVMKTMPWSFSRGGRKERPLLDVFLIDTESWRGGSRRRKSRRDALRRLLMRSRARWKIVCGHHPIFGNGKKKDDVVLVRTLRPVLREFGVDFYLAGHQHNLQVLADRLADRSERLPLYVVAGGGGAGPATLKRSRGSFFQAEALGFAVLDFHEDRVRVRIVDTAGRTLHDGTRRKRGSYERSKVKGDER